MANQKTSRSTIAFTCIYGGATFRIELNFTSLIAAATLALRIYSIFAAGAH